MLAHAPAGEMSGIGNPAGILARLQAVRRRLGLGLGCLYLLQRALRRLTGNRLDLGWHWLMMQPVPGAALLDERWRQGIDVRPLGMAEAALHGALSQAGDLDRRAARGDTCIAAFQGGRLAGHLWLCFAGFDDEETCCSFRPADGGAWDFDLSVLPASRGGPVFAALWDGAARVLRERGCRWSASRVSAVNDLSLRSHRRLGAYPVGSFLVLRLGAWRVICASMAPRLRFVGPRTPYARVDVRMLEEQPVYSRPSRRCP